MNVRPYRPADRDALADVCVRTADSGRDATGMLANDRLWAEIYLLPYLERHPDLAFVLEDDDATPVGYIVGTDDTDDFDAWFRDAWWPAHRESHAGSGNDRQQRLIAAADAREPFVWEHAGTYPAHLHIDILPAGQGRGHGRTLIEHLCAALGRRGVPGVHAVTSSRNEGAVAFYPRAEFTELPVTGEERAFGRDLRADQERV